MQEKILLVDDDVSILLLVSDVLEEKGLEVTAVRSGECRTSPARPPPAI